MGDEAGQWRGRPGAARLLRAAIAVGPLAAGAAVGITVGAVLPAPHTTPTTVAWWAAVLAVSTAFMAAADFATRRLLPLAVLLDLALAFPDQAPSRFKLALKTGSPKHVHEHMAAAEKAGVAGGDPARTAESILALVAALGTHHPQSRKHSERVRAYTELLGEELHLPARDRHRLRWAALLHDIGKVDVPVEVLNGTGPLTDAGWATIHRHPIDGAALIEPLRGWLGPWAPTVEQHHERHDGTGYPHGLAGEEICLGARMVAVADSFEAMTARRTYQEPMPLDKARARLAELSGTQFDPAVVRAFLALSLRKLRWAYGPLAWLAEVPALVALTTGAAKAGAATLGVTVAVAAAGGPPQATTVAGVVFDRAARGAVVAAASESARPARANRTPAPTPTPTSVTAGPAPSTSTSTSATSTTSTSTSTTLLPPVTLPPVTLPPITVPPVNGPTIPPLPVQLP